MRILDLGSLQSVRSFAAAWDQRPLHILFNNAGIFDIGGRAFLCSLQADTLAMCTGALACSACGLGA